MKKEYVFPDFPHFLHGGDYNPDQWRKYPEILQEDMRLMKLANCNTMSVGIFAWAALEPEEGKFDFSFLDKTLDDVYANGGRVLLATPSGARPAWMAQKYPEVLRVDENRVRRWFGGRHNHCLTSPVYREKVAKINGLLAERYARHPALIGWHVSNEYSGECHCELCRAAFREWLKKKYGTLDELNDQWWTAFWSHTYTEWDQIDPPSPLGERTLHGLYLDWRRFTTDQTIDFFKHEIAPLRKYTPNAPVTTNFMGFSTCLDYRKFAKEVDFVSHDAYPTWRGDDTDVELASEVAMRCDLNRSLKLKPFIQMECTPSNVNHHPYNKLKRPGMHMLSSMQLLAHGSDSVLYFQWRKSRGGPEKFHGAVVDHVGHGNTRVFRDVAEVGARLRKLEDVLAAPTVSRVGLVYDWQNRWMLDKARGFQLTDKKIYQTLKKHYDPLWKRGVNTDVIGFEDDFSRYDLIIAPQLYLTGEALIGKIEAFVREGGTILCTYMTGMVNENDRCYPGGFPGGKLKEVFGIWNEEIDTLYPEESNRVEWRGKTYRAVDYCELLHAEGAETLAVYGKDFYAGMPALTVHPYGKGKAYYAAFRGEDDFLSDLTGYLLEERGIVSDFDGALPFGVTAHSRTDGDTVCVFLQNFTARPQESATALQWVTVEEKRPVTGPITLAPYETLILERKAEKTDG
ncbi:MAG: beta-galactosidase [Clostridia bacterium]|nr:beta-galactosidase [Clostridia bacterium]